MLDDWSTEKKLGVAALGIGVVLCCAVLAGRGRSTSGVRLRGLSLPGGRGEKRKPWEFDTDQFIRGMQVEMEHTSDWCIAGQIVMDHLDENPDYYGAGLPNCPKGERLVCLR